MQPCFAHCMDQFPHMGGIVHILLGLQQIPVDRGLQHIAVKLLGHLDGILQHSSARGRVVALYARHQQRPALLKEVKGFLAVIVDVVELAFQLVELLRQHVPVKALHIPQKWGTIALQQGRIQRQRESI